MINQEFELKTKLKIRDAKADDAEELYSYCFANEEPEDIKEELNSDVKKMADGQVYRLVGDVSGQAVANIRMERSPFDPEIGKISRLAVARLFRGSNIADRLVAGIEDIAAQNGIKILRVEIPESKENIIKAYKRWEFTETPVIILQKELKLEENEPQEADDENEEKDEESTQLDLGVNDEKKE